MTQEQRACATDKVLLTLGDARDVLRDARSIVALIGMATEHNQTDEDSAISFACAQVIERMEEVDASLICAALHAKGGAQ